VKVRDVSLFFLLALEVVGLVVIIPSFLCSYALTRPRTNIDVYSDSLIEVGRLRYLYIDTNADHLNRHQKESDMKLRGVEHFKIPNQHKYIEEMLT